MPLIVKDSGDFLSVPAGMHLGRCYRIVDKGTQRGFQDKLQPTVMLQFEIHGEDAEGQPLTTKDGRPLSQSKSYNCTLSEKSNLRQDLQMWRGRDFTAQELRGFELKNVLGAWAMLTIIHKEANGKIYTKIVAINPVPANIKKAGMPEGVNELQIFDIENPDMKIFDSFSEKLKSEIMSSPEWQALHGEEPEKDTPKKEGGFAELDDDIPF
jgi:hypothetical protein